MEGAVVEVTAEEELRALVGEPKPVAAIKERRVLHEHDRAWLAASPFCLIATAAADGTCDVSPKGDPPGFTLVLLPVQQSLAELERYYGPEYARGLYEQT